MDAAEVAGHRDAKPRGIVMPDEPPLVDQYEEALTPIELRGARRLGEAWPVTPHFYLTRQCAAEALLRRHREVNADPVNPRISLTALLVSLVGRTLRDHPRMNAQYVDGRRRLYRDINVGVAVATDAGLTVPIIRKADELGMDNIALELGRLVAAARGGRLAVDDVIGGTFTISNVGDLGIDMVLPVINPPQAAIIGIGRIRDVPCVVEGVVRAAPAMDLALAVDHRVADGVTAARFLADLAGRVEAR